MLLQVHRLDIDSERQHLETTNLAKFDHALVLAYKRYSLFGMLYDHYFVTDGKWTIEFRGDEVAEAIVHVHGRHPGYYDVEQAFTNSEDVQNRMRRVCGARAFSFCFRNCEHVARYIAEGRWFSRQSAADGILWSKCLSKLAGEHQLKLNMWPWELEPVPVLSSNGWKGFLGYKGQDCHVTHNPDVFTVLALGSEKETSRLIEALFEMDVSRPRSAKTVPCKLEVTHGLAEIGGCTRAVQVIQVIGLVEDCVEKAKVLTAHLLGEVLHVDRVLVALETLPLTNAMCELLRMLGVRQHTMNFTFAHCKLTNFTGEVADGLLLELHLQLGAEAHAISTPYVRTHGEHHLSLEYLNQEQQPSRILAAANGLPEPQSADMVHLLVPGLFVDHASPSVDAASKLLDATFLPCADHFLSRDWRLQLGPASDECQIQ